MLLLKSHLKFIHRALRRLKDLDGELEDDVDARELKEEHEDQGNEERQKDGSIQKLTDSQLKKDISIRKTSINDVT